MSESAGQKSKCCGGELRLSESDEGTNFYLCGKCAEPCDPAPAESSRACEHDRGFKWARSLSEGKEESRLKKYCEKCPFCAPKAECAHKKMKPGQIIPITNKGECFECGEIIRPKAEDQGKDKRIEELEIALYRMFDCKYEPDKLTCIYERAVPLKRRNDIKQQEKL